MYFKISSKRVCRQAIKLRMTAKKDKEKLFQRFFYSLVRKMNQLDTEGAVTIVESPKLRKIATTKVKR